MRDGGLVSYTYEDLVKKVQADVQELIFLGVSVEDSDAESSNAAYLAIDLESDRAQVLEDETTQWDDLRVVGNQLSDKDAGLFTQALALANWHRSHRHAPQTGQPTVSGQYGWIRHPLEDPSAAIFPRTDAAVIVLVTDQDDRLLLGNNAMWESNRFSLLAGYVEPGESLEAAVIREVFEESGLTVDNPEYKGSQPWPFPASLMLGFTAQVAPGVDPNKTQADGEEILDLKWFTREELLASVEDILLPGPVSIARALIESWLGHEFPQGDVWATQR